MSYAQRLEWITAIVTTTTDFADKHSEATITVSIDCGMYEVVTIKLQNVCIKLQNVCSDSPNMKERVYVHLYEDEIKVEGKAYAYTDLPLFVERFRSFLLHKYKNYF